MVIALRLDRDQVWRRLEDGTMELISEVFVEREDETQYSSEEYLVDLDFRLSMIELGL